MSKTLVGLYDTLTDAERVVQDLSAEGFSRSAIRVVAPDGAARRGTDTRAGEWITPEGGTDIVDTLIDLGVPTDEASSYAEGIRRGGALVIVESSDDWADRGLEIMNRIQAVDIDERTTQWRQEGWTGTASRAASSTTTAATARTDTTATTAANVRTEARSESRQGGRRLENDKEVTIPVVEEEISVGKREVERGRVRVHTRVTERPVEESVRLREERVEVERRPVDRPATAADLKAGQEETIELTETAEEAVVSKRARVVEEVVVRKDVDEHVETVRDTVRRTDVDIDRDADTRVRTGATTGFSTYDADWRQHHGTTFMNRGAYADYEPAYRYGYDLSSNERYRGRDWTALEADARRDWEARQPGTWERFKDAIRYSWSKVGSGDTTATRGTTQSGQTGVGRMGTPAADFSSYDTDYRQHHSATFQNRGAYEEYMPAYRYGYDLASDERYRGRNWTDLEADFRRGWETQRPGTWERFKDSIRYSWDKVLGRV